MLDEFQSKVITGVPLYEVWANIGLITSPSVELLLKRGTTEFPKTVSGAFNRVLRVETVLAITSGTVDAVYDFRIIKWTDYPWMIRCIRRLQSMIRFFMFGCMQRRPEFYDKLLGISAVPEYAFFDQVLEEMKKCGVPPILSSVLLVNLQPIIYPKSRKQLVRSLLKPQPDCVEVLYKFSIRDNVHVESETENQEMRLDF
jgi:hypothetical protein